jgi:mono/diheme cytochrome c family protein
MKRLCIALLLVCAAGATGGAAEDGQQRGKTLLEKMCARCHAVGLTGKSPHQDAPPFRTFRDDKLYDNNFAQRLQDGLSTIHPDMPTFHFSREDADAAVNYLRSIQVQSKPQLRR